MSLIPAKDFAQLLLKATPILDVRAPVEFLQGSLPNSVNLPILNDSERALVGTVYKQKGPEEAVRLGYELVSGTVREDRIGAWKKFLLQK